MKPLEALFLSTNDPWFSWLKYQILKYFRDWLKTIEVTPGVYEKSEKQNIFILSKFDKGPKNGCTFYHYQLELACKVFDSA